VLVLQHPVLVLVFKQWLCLSLARWLGQETALWTAFCHFRQWLICRLLSVASFAGFVYWQFMWRAAPLPFSGGEACQPATSAVSVYWKFEWRAAPCSSLLLLCSQSTLPPLLHVLFSSLFIIQFFLWGGGQSVQGEMLVYPRSGCGSTACCLFAHLLFHVSQAGLELVSGGAGTLLVSQRNMACRSFVWAGGLGCWSFAYYWHFFSAKCGSSISARSLIYRSHAVCFLPLVTIWDPLHILLG
jgi:hypothetical protein